MLTQTKVEKAHEAESKDSLQLRHPLSWSGWELQLGRNERGTFGVWTFRGQPVVMVNAGKA